MYLDDRDRTALTGFVRRENVLRRLGPFIAVLDVLIAVVVFFVLEDEVRYILPVILVIAGVVAAFVLVRVIDRGEASAASVLGGKDPVRTVSATVVGQLGDPPYPWTFELDSPASGERYLHLGPATDDDWRLQTGERYRVAFFTERRPYRGVVMVTPEGGSGRHWLYSASLSDSDRYVHVSQ
jgi:hypothetical protein